MELYEIEGFLRGKCLPGDLLVGESNAQYLFRKLKEREALAVENESLKAYRPQPGGMAMMEALDAFEAQDDYPEGGMMNAFKILCCKRLPTPATDAAIANIQAQGVDRLADHLSGLNIMASETSVREFAAQLRKESTHD